MDTRTARRRRVNRIRRWVATAGVTAFVAAAALVSQPAATTSVTTQPAAVVASTASSDATTQADSAVAPVTTRQS